MIPPTISLYVPKSREVFFPMRSAVIAKNVVKKPNMAIKINVLTPERPSPTPTGKLSKLTKNVSVKSLKPFGSSGGSALIWNVEKIMRSEERRVGKECRSWCSPTHERKKL